MLAPERLIPAMRPKICDEPIATPRERGRVSKL